MPEPVELVIERDCHFKQKPCALCGLPKSNRAHSPKRTATCAGKWPRGCATCGANKGDARHYGAPPSLNVFGGGDARVFLSHKQTWERLLAAALNASGLPRGLTRVLAEGEVTFPDEGRRDQGNFRVLLEKSLGDVLVKGAGDVEGGWLEDDDWTRYEFGGLARNNEPGVSRTRIMLFPDNQPLEAGADAAQLALAGADALHGKGRREP